MSAADGIDWTTAGPLAAAFVGGGFAFVKGWIVPGKTYERELHRNDKQARQLETLQATLQDDFLPAYREGVEALKTITPFLRSEVHSPGPSGGG